MIDIEEEANQGPAIMGTDPDLETDLHDLILMAHIAATLLENSFGDRKTHEEITHLPNTYYVIEEDADAMIFASYEVHNRLKALRNKYLAR
jgi:hypothetical protein